MLDEPYPLSVFGDNRMTSELTGLVGLVTRMLPPSTFEASAHVNVPNASRAEIFKLLLEHYTDVASRFEGDSLVVTLSPPLYKGILDWKIFFGVPQWLMNGAKWYGRWSARFNVVPHGNTGKITAHVDQTWALSALAALTPVGWSVVLFTVWRIGALVNPRLKTSVQLVVDEVVNTLDKRATLERLSSQG